MLSLEHEKEECYSGALASWHLKKWALAEPFDIQVKYTNTITIFTGFRPRHSAVLAERLFFFLLQLSPSIRRNIPCKFQLSTRKFGRSGLDILRLGPQKVGTDSHLVYIHVNNIQDCLLAYWFNYFFFVQTFNIKFYDADLTLVR